MTQDAEPPEETPKSATIHMHPNGWNPQAAIHQALAEVGKDTRAILISWLDADGNIRRNFSGTNGQLAWMLMVMQAELTRRK